MGRKILVNLNDEQLPLEKEPEFYQSDDEL